MFSQLHRAELAVADCLLDCVEVKYVGGANGFLEFNQPLLLLRL